MYFRGTRLTRERSRSAGICSRSRRISRERNRKAPFLRGWRGRIRGINRGRDNGILNGGRIDTAAKCRTVGVNRSTSRRCQRGRGRSCIKRVATLLLVVTNICTTRCESIRSISCPRTLKRSETIKYVFSNRVAFLWLKVWYLRITWNFFKRMNNRICHTNFIYPIIFLLQF